LEAGSNEWIEKMHSCNQNYLDRERGRDKIVRKINISNKKSISRKSTSRVLQEMKTIKFTKGKWHTFPTETFNNIEKLRKNIKEILCFSGIYVFLSVSACGKVTNCLYIGSSNNMGKRLNIHSGYMGLLHSFSRHEKTFLKLKIRKDKARFERLSLEARLIFRLKPKYNSNQFDSEI